MKPKSNSVVKTCVFIYFICLFDSFATSANDQPISNEARPNVVLMMVDDMGFSDLGCYGGEIETPNIDRLAKRGIRFNQFYNCAKCETTRSTMLSGRYYPEVNNQKLDHCITIAEGMKLAGYRTFMTGKWHLEGNPVDRGFDRYFGHLSGATNFFTGDNTFRIGKEKFEVPKKDFYTTDANVDYAMKFLQEGRESDDPFFLYIAFNAPHYPLQAPEEDVRKYIGKYRGGWDQLRTDRFRRQLQMGVIDSTTKLSPRPDDVPAWDSLTPAEQEHQDLMMATYVAMIDRVDQNVGRLVKHLEETNQIDNTLIMLLSDNGACPFQRTKLRSVKEKLAPWDSKSYWTYDKRWAHACNTPFREYKQNQHEGGITTPFIAHWPTRIGSEIQGKVTNQSAHIVDIMATCLDIASTKYPVIYKSEKVGPPRGVSLLPAFALEKLERVEPIFFSFYGKNNAIREGDWKIVNKNFEKFELYNLANDRSELNDVSESSPEKFKAMRKQLDRLFEKVGQPVRKKNTKRNSKSGNQKKSGNVKG